MSYYFEVGDETVWNPASRVGELYVGMLEAAAAVLKVPSGLTPGADESYIDMPVFEVLVQKMLAYRIEVGHPAMSIMLDGILPLSIMLVEKGGGTLAVTTEQERRYLTEARDKLL
ncbi:MULTISPECIES: DUF6086 family protein [Streptomycetaceae]|nr:MULTISPECIES: DUF6086 family protein [Streptomycetaceae]MYS58437.1 hypothetical protein [Streptomyces sp. SID5468]CCB74094.1 conserved protein of unknown function [Streptantibioticus cattleyicolor NRRL 8057 = DSM 46488]